MWSERQHMITAALSWLAAVLFAASALSSCSDDGSEPRPASAADGREVYIQAIVGNTPSSRAPYKLTAPSVDAPLDALVWASLTPGSYASAAGLDESTVETTALFLSGMPQLISGVQYPENDEPLYFVAMHPETGWTADNNVAYFTFTGCEDLLYAEETSGRRGHAAPLPKLVFKHLLTWLHVKMRAEDEAAAEAWGELQSLTVKSLTRACVALNPGSGTPFYFDGHEEMFKFRIAGSDDFFPGTDKILPFDGKSEREAYVLCAPITVVSSDGADLSDEKYVIELKTENRTARLTVDTSVGDKEFADGSTMGHKFTLNLCFGLGLNITARTTVDEWVYGGSASTTIDQ